MPTWSALSLLAFAGLSAAARFGPGRSVLVAGIYPDRPWEKANAADSDNELERRLAQLEADLSSQRDLARTQSELETQLAQPPQRQAQPVARRLVGPLGKRDLANLRLSLALWVLLGLLASYRWYVSRPWLPASVCLAFALAGSMCSVVELVQAAVDWCSRRWGDARPERQLKCYRCQITFGVPKGSEAVSCPLCGAVNKVTKSFF